MRTKELIEAQKQGKRVVYPVLTPELTVVYKPRHRNDPMPWKSYDYRFFAWELEVR